ncbi:hypothetical protein [Winogradskya humida]|uniref:Uncharacterized protein n=1 Tax=Winogradskya humida TaxID=113566 RepID=A0ABQ4A6N2_9ACTN|nr:hypothetical protein [Actinoplanes humidus]GIE26510.1 hypothetical protein Ahu01nite_096120 [Actinoplanes humidus]
MTDSLDEQTRPARWSRFWRRVMTIWSRFLGFLRGPAPAPQLRVRLLERRSITPITVPARGFAFNFQVHGVFVWESDDMARIEELREMVDHFLPYAHHHLKVAATGPARQVEPHRGEEFEALLRRTLDEFVQWTYLRRGLRVTCRPEIRVQLDERVRQHIRPYWEQLITLDYERDLADRRARHTDGISKQWSVILDQLLSGPAPDGAASMTDEQLAHVVKGLLAERAAADQLLADGLAGLDPQNEYEREGYFDLLSERRSRRAAG